GACSWLPCKRSAGKALQMTSPCDPLDRLFADLGDTFGALPAISDGRALSLSYTDLARVAAETRNALRALGLARQDRLAVVLPQSVPAILAWIGAASALTTLPFRSRTTAFEAADLMARAGVRAVLVPLDGAEAAREAAAGLALPVLDYAWNGALRRLDLSGPALGPAAPDQPAAPHDLAVLYTTSGTTGRPRIVPRIHRASTDTMRASIIDSALGPGARTLLIPPATTPFGQTEFLFSCSIGALTIVAGQIDPSGVEDMVTRFDVDWITLTPAHIAFWTRQRAETPLPRLPRLRWVACGAGSLTDQLRAAAEAALGVPVLNLFGSSENLRVSLERIPRDLAEGTAGWPITEVRVVEDNGTDAAPGAVGILLVRGPSVFSGYLDDPEATARAFTPDGWQITGDRAILHPDGSLSVLGRDSDLIDRGGDKIDPAEVEAVLLAHPGVADCAVFAVPDASYGHAPAAAVHLAPDAAVTIRDLRRWLLDHLAPHKAPRQIVLTGPLPRTATGKIRRAALADLLPAPPSPTSHPTRGRAAEPPT
ncbi:MAG: class I adenylate-forming enzyme family protein, partial [Thermomicrobiales bacterium]